MARSQHQNVVRLPGTLGEPQLIPNGQYRVALNRHQVSTRFGRGSLELWFKVMDYGEYFESEVCRYYKVTRDGQRSFRVGPNSDFAREFAAVFGKRAPTGLEAVRCYRGEMLVADIRIVTTGHRQKPIPEAARYNVIDQLISKAET